MNKNFLLKMWFPARNAKHSFGGRGDDKRRALWWHYDGSWTAINPLDNFGGPYQTRTGNLFIANEALYHWAKGPPKLSRIHDFVAEQNRDKSGVLPTELQALLGFRGFRWLRSDLDHFFCGFQSFSSWSSGSYDWSSHRRFLGLLLHRDLLAF